MAMSSSPATAMTPSERLLASAKDGTLRTKDEVIALLREGAEFSATTLFSIASFSDFPITSLPEDEYTALHFAAMHGHDLTVQALLDAGMDVNCATASYGLTPLQLAAKFGHESTVRLLCARKAQVDAMNEFHTTALLLATVSGDVATVRALIELGADTKVQSLQGMNALDIAISFGQLAMVDALLEAGVDATVSDERRHVSLCRAAAQAELDTSTVVQTIQLLANSGAAVNALNPYDNSRSALHAAMLSGHAGAVHTLLTVGARIEEGDCAGACRALVERHADAPTTATTLMSLMGSGLDLHSFVPR